MRTPPANELLDIWERGQAQPHVGHALALLAAACPGTPPGDLCRLSIGRRDAQLLALRARIFGPRFAALAPCPGCGNRLELAFDVTDLLAAQPPETAEEMTLVVGDYAAHFRLPNGLDLAALDRQSDIATARRALLDSCMLDLRRGDAAVSPEQLPDEVVAAVAERMAVADPLADVQLALECPVCGRTWQATFDIVSFFWAELDAWARRTLREVHRLATAYHWREADILAMSARRRQRYLELIGP